MVIVILITLPPETVAVAAAPEPPPPLNETVAELYPLPPPAALFVLSTVTLATPVPAGLCPYLIAQEFNLLPQTSPNSQ